MDYAREFQEMANAYYGGKEVWDDALRIEILQQELHIAQNPVLKYPPRGKPYFSPSSANSCLRELQLKVRGATKDVSTRTPIQSRWTAIGTRVGEEVQHMLLKAEKHWPTIGSGESPFAVHRTEDGYPFWEDYVKRFTEIDYKGQTIRFFGKGDGVMRHRASDELVGLEVKSKSTTPAQTSFYSMKDAAKDDHISQCVAYSLLYPELDLKNYVIAYWNVAKKGWNADADTDPDLRTFNVEITEEMQTALLDRLHLVLSATEEGRPLKLELGKFTFNNYKTACALDLSTEEVEALKEEVRQMKASSLPQYLKNNYHEAMKTIVDIRRTYGKDH